MRRIIPLALLVSLPLALVAPVSAAPQQERRVALVFFTSFVLMLAAPALVASAQAVRWGAPGIGIEPCRALAQRSEAAAAV